MKNVLWVLGYLQLLLLTPKQCLSTLTVHNCFWILKSMDHFPQFRFFLMKAVAVVANQKKCDLLSNQLKIRCITNLKDTFNGQIASCGRCSKIFGINEVVKNALNVHLGKLGNQFRLPEGHCKPLDRVV